MKLVWLLMIVLVQKSLQNDENTILVQVNRRLSNDIEYYSDNKTNTCNEELKVTLLVNERQCVTNEELLTGIK